MTVAKNRERGLDVEDLACDRWSLEPIAHAHEDRDGWYDLEFTDDLEGELTGPIALEGDRVEVKSCWDRHANGNGRWWIRLENRFPEYEHELESVVFIFQSSRWAWAGRLPRSIPTSTSPL